MSEFNGSTWTTYTTEDGLAHNYVLAIAIDGAGNRWFGTDGGLSVLLADLNHFTYLPIVVNDL